MKFVRREHQEASVEMTPLIDVVFLLLIFFMVSTTFIRETQLKIDLPEAGGELQEIGDDVIEIVVDRLVLDDDTERSRVIDSVEQALRFGSGRMLTVDADIEVIDLPPHLSGSAVASLAVCDLAVIPCGASAADISATAKTLELVERAREVRAGHPPVLIVPTRIDWRTGSGRAIEGALAQFGEPVGPGIAQRVAFADSLGIGEWIGQYAPGSPGHQEILILADIVRGVLRETNDATHELRKLTARARAMETEAGGLQPEPEAAS